jgi:hypothetical protein
VDELQRILEELDRWLSAERPDLYGRWATGTLTDEKGSVKVGHAAAPRGKRRLLSTPTASCR